MRARAASPSIGAIYTRCGCTECRSLDRAHPRDGWQLRLPISSGDQPDAIPLPDPDATTAATVIVSAPEGRTVEMNARGREAGVP